MSNESGDADAEGPMIYLTIGVGLVKCARALLRKMASSVKVYTTMAP